LALRVQLVLPLSERLRCRSGAAAGDGLAAEEFRVCTRNLERQANHFVGRLSIRKQNQEITRLSGVLLLSTQRSVPIDRFVQNSDDLFARQYRYAGVGCAGGGRITRIHRMSPFAADADDDNDKS